MWSFADCNLQNTINSQFSIFNSQVGIKEFAKLELLNPAGSVKDRVALLPDRGERYLSTPMFEK